MAAGEAIAPPPLFFPTHSAMSRTPPQISGRYQVALTPVDEPHSAHRLELCKRKAEAFDLARSMAATPAEKVGEPFAVQVFDTMARKGAKAHWTFPQSSR